ncbi:MAG: aminotransferase class III-fold pyridoxal phosphate-dependent enzyme [Candidatus Omnitrophica bacterium]|nr:aminotransferase class III-fold pyridoxal phosphate-dependent enzyme [Candidatus Omnitrophota bacterium]
MISLRQKLNVYEPLSVQNLGQQIPEWRNAKGAHVAGYIDFTSGLLTANIGHDNQSVSDAIAKCRGWSGWYAPTQHRLATYRALDSILPRYLDRYILLSTGSEGIDCAIKIAVDNGFRVLTHERSYHGSTIGAGWAGGLAKSAFFGKCGHIERLSEEDKTAVLLETFIGPWCEWYPPSFIETLKNLQHKGGIVIFDEMQAGFGRTGTWFGFEHYHLAPDIVVGGKAAAGGMPFAFVAGRAELLDKNPEADYVSTFSGNPFGCAACVATIAEIRSKHLLDKVKRDEGIIRQAAERMQEKGLIDGFMGKGFAFSFYMVNAAKVVEVARNKGLLLIDTGRGTVKIAPPLVISRADLRIGLKVIEDAIKVVRRRK